MWFVCSSDPRMRPLPSESLEHGSTAASRCRWLVERSRDSRVHNGLARMAMINRGLAVIAIGVLCVIHSWSAPRAQVVLLGTGTPGPDPNRSGPATAIAVDDRA